MRGAEPDSDEISAAGRVIVHDRAVRCRERVDPKLELAERCASIARDCIAIVALLARIELKIATSNSTVCRAGLRGPRILIFRVALSSVAGFGVVYLGVVWLGVPGSR